MRQLFISLVLVLIPLIVFSQKSRRLTGTVSVVTVDSVEVLQYANVAILNAGDSTLVSDAMTDDKGKFSIQYKPAKNRNFLLRIGYTGMDTYFRHLPDTLSNFNLGNIVMQSKNELGEVVVSAPIKIIDMKGDTTVINAEAFKTREGANLLELINRIPGLVYNKVEKKIFYNGEELKGININGEDFLSGKIDLAVENLQAEIVSKFKIYDKASEDDKFLGIKKNDRQNLVLDIKTKKKFNGTVMAAVAAGGGTYDKKEVKGDLNYFNTGGNQFMLMVKSGNKDNSSPGKNNRVDNDFLNFNKRFNEKISLGGNVSYFYNRNNSQSSTFNEQYLAQGNQYDYSDWKSGNNSWSLHSNVRFSWQPDTATQISVSVNYSGTKSRGTTLSHSASFTQPVGLPIKNPFDDLRYPELPDSVKINEMNSNSSSFYTNNNFGIDADVSRKLNNKGTSVSLYTRYSGTDGSRESFSISSTRYFKIKDCLGKDSTLYRNQYQDSPNDQYSLETGLRFTQKFGEKANLQLSYSYNRSRQNSNRNTFDLSPFSDILSTMLPEGYKDYYIDSLSNTSTRKTGQHGLELSFGYYDEKLNSNIRLKVTREKQTLDQKYGKSMADTVCNRVELNPNAYLYWNNKKLSVSFQYYGQTRQPELSQIVNFIDNADPLNISMGNPDLKPQYYQTIRLEVRHQGIGINGTLSCSNQFNSIAQSVNYDLNTGGRISKPVNVNGNNSYDAAVGYNKMIKEKINISTDAAFAYRTNVGLINESMKEMPDRSVTRTKTVNLMLRTSYSPKWGGFNLNATWGFDNDVNSLRQMSTYTRNYTLNFNAYFDLPADIQLRSDVVYNYRSGSYVSSDLSSEVVWNTALAWRFLKRRQAEITLEWIDILNDSKSYSRYASSMSLTESYSRRIGSYVFLSFSYRFNTVMNGRPERQSSMMIRMM